MTFKNIRVTLLLLILAYVSFDSLLSNARVTNWIHPLRIVIYPINADDSEKSSQYIAGLQVMQFDDINKLIQSESSRYGLNLTTPLQIGLSQSIKSKPPALPENRSVLSGIVWSLKLRYWSWKNDNYKGISPQIRAYALFYDPSTHKHLKHSTGLKNGKLAIIKLFADSKNAQQNNIVILHEILHTLGATDKYKLATGQPIFPDGLANPKQQPTYPQKLAEIMGGRIAISAFENKMPISLQKTVIGTKTAGEIGWLK